MAADIEPTATSEQPLKPKRSISTRDAARKIVKPMRSIAIFGAVGALVAAVALPAYASSSSSVTDSPVASLQQVAEDDAQSLVVASVAAASPLDRSTYSATTPEEIAEKKAEEAAKAAAEAAAKAAAAAASTSYSSSSFDISNYALTAPGSGEVRYPLPQGSYTQGRTLSSGHDGADMLAPAGTPIYAATSGVVRVSSEGYYGYGVAVVIDGAVGGQSVSTVYAHMTYGSRQVSAGQTVQAGQLIGLVGSTGRSTANHLHFEVNIGGGLYEPYAWLAANAG